MNTFTYEGKLPVGVEHDGKVHTTFEIRAHSAKDTIEVHEEYGSDALENTAFFTLCVIHRLLVKLGDIPEKELTFDFLQENLMQADMLVLDAGVALANNKAATFRKEKAGKGSKKAGGPSPEA
jgi:hypothetical protein